MAEDKTYALLRRRAQDFGRECDTYPIGHPIRKKLEAIYHLIVELADDTRRRL